jgi:hypothetical protein
MSTEIHLKRENDRLRREISELRAKIAELEARLPKEPPAVDKKPEEKPKFNPFQPVRPGLDPYWDFVQSQKHPRRRSWLE